MVVSKSQSFIRDYSTLAFELPVGIRSPQHKVKNNEQVLSPFARRRQFQHRRDRQNKRRSNRRERRLISELAAQADSFVSPLLSGLSSNAGFGSERQFSNPAASASRS